MKKILLAAIGILMAVSMHAQAGAALDFDGMDDKVTINGLDISPGVIPTLTISVWAKRTEDDPFFQHIVDNDDGGYDRAISVMDSTYHIFAGRDINTGISSTLNVWEHITVMWSPTRIDMYKNGLHVFSDGGDSSSVGPNFTVIGGYNLPFTGQIDEVRFFDTIVCPSLLYASYNCELTGSEPGLIAYYKFNQGIASGSNLPFDTAPDASPSGLTGTLTGFALSGSTSNWIAPGGVASGVTCTPIVSAEISILGNGVTITDGDVTPSITDDTDFGTLVCGASSVIKTFTIKNTGGSPLHMAYVISSGTDAADFSPSAPTAIINSGDSSTFTITFNPGGLGIRTANIEVRSDDCDETFYNFSVSGAMEPDTMAPIPDIDPLPDAMGVCTLTVVEPMALDACMGPIVAMTGDPTFYNVPGTYNITWYYNDGNGNISSQNQQVILDPCLGIEETGIVNMTVYPNPTDGIFTVNTSPSLTNVEIQLLDVIGQVLYAGPLQNTSQVFDFTYLSPGIYHVQVRSSQGTTSQRIIVR